MSYETNIVEIRKVYVDHLVDTLTPLLYEGFITLYKNAKAKYKELIDEGKETPNIVIIFKLFLNGVPKLNDNMIETETTRIRDHSGCSEYFDDLIRAVIRSSIILLTFNYKKVKLVDEKFNKKINTNTFIHKCYIECARIFYEQPELFWDEYSSSELKQNQIVIYKFINKAIMKAIQHTLPMKEILEEYLKKDGIATQYNKKELVQQYLKKEETKKEDEDGLNDFIYNRKFEIEPEKIVIDREGGHDTPHTPIQQHSDIKVSQQHVKENYYDENI